MNEEEIIKIINHLEPYDLPYSTDNVYVSIKKLVDLYEKEKEKNKEIEKDILFFKRIIDEMAEQLAGIAIWNNEKEEPLILVSKEEVIEYYEGRCK